MSKSMKMSEPQKVVAKLVGDAIAKMKGEPAPKTYPSVCWDCGKILKTKRQVKRGFCNKVCEDRCVKYNA